MAALRREDINRLPIEERLRLIEDIWESIRETPEGPALTDAQRKELDRSLRAFEADPTAVRDLDEILASLHRRA